MAEKAIIHEGFVCSCCSMNPIVGTRYLCSKCYSHSDCQKCFEKMNLISSNTAHEMHPIYVPIKGLFPPKEKIVHEDIECDGCEMFPVIGNCYECQTCEDFNYCQNCYQLKEHKFYPKHDFSPIVPCKGLKHMQFQCEGCQMKPIVGIRYLCEKCKNYNLCEKCFKAKKHEHRMHPITLPINLLPPAPKGAIFSVTCHRCKKMPIDDNCYVCQTCKDFYLCEKCHQFDLHISGHKFGDINKKYIIE